MTTSQRLEALYARLPTIECRRLCQGSCGPITYTRAEGRRMRAVAGVEPQPDPRTLTCSMLSEDGSCAVYAVRPLICRLYGLVRMMQCPFGCRPERFLTNAECEQVMREVTEIGGPFAGYVFEKHLVLLSSRGQAQLLRDVKVVGGETPGWAVTR